MALSLIICTPVAAAAAVLYPCFRFTTARFHPSALTWRCHGADDEAFIGSGGVVYTLPRVIHQVGVYGGFRIVITRVVDCWGAVYKVESINSVKHDTAVQDAY